MKTFKSILMYVGLSLTALIAFVFMFLEMRSLFAGDFTLMENELLGFLTYLFKGLYFLSIVALAVSILIFKIRSKKICIILFMSSIGLLIGSFITFIYFVYFISFVIVFINAILVAITSIEFLKKD